MCLSLSLPSQMLLPSHLELSPCMQKKPRRFSRECVYSILQHLDWRSFPQLCESVNYSSTFNQVFLSSHLPSESFLSHGEWRGSNIGISKRWLKAAETSQRQSNSNIPDHLGNPDIDDLNDFTPGSGVVPHPGLVGGSACGPSLSFFIFFSRSCSKEKVHSSEETSAVPGTDEPGSVEHQRQSRK